MRRSVPWCNGFGTSPRQLCSSMRQTQATNGAVDHPPRCRPAEIRPASTSPAPCPPSTTPRPPARRPPRAPSESAAAASKPAAIVLIDRLPIGIPPSGHHPQDTRWHGIALCYHMLACLSESRSRAAETLPPSTNSARVTRFQSTTAQIRRNTPPTGYRASAVRSLSQLGVRNDAGGTTPGVGLDCRTHPVGDGCSEFEAVALVDAVVLGVLAAARTAHRRLRVRGRRRCVGARVRGGRRGVDRGARAAAPRCRGGARGVFVRFRRAWCVAGRRRPECRAPRPRRSICLLRGRI